MSKECLKGQEIDERNFDRNRAGKRWRGEGEIREGELRSERMSGEEEEAGVVRARRTQWMPRKERSILTFACACMCINRVRRGWIVPLPMSKPS